MRRIAYSTLLASVCDRMGWNEDLLDADEFSSARRALSQALAEIQEDTWWRDLVRAEQRRFRDLYDPSITYSPLDEVYHPGSDAYYQALRESTGEDPAAQDEHGEWEVNLAFWARAELDPEVEDFDFIADYEPGDRVLGPDDGRIYQCHTASAGNFPTNTDYWGPLQPFVPYVPWQQVGQTRIGAVRAVTVLDPRTHIAPMPIRWEPNHQGVQVFGLDPSRPWVEFRLPTPRLTGKAWNPTATYQAVPLEESGETPSTPGGGGGEGGAFIAIQGRVQLRARSQHEPNEAIFLSYLILPGDGQGGMFEFEATEMTADDDVDFFKPDDINPAAPGRWVRSINP
jgi:hypothetical protein